MAGYNEETEILTYEIAYSREELGNYFGVSEFDKIHIRIIPVMFDESGYKGEVWFGFVNWDLNPYYTTWFYRYPHVLHLGATDPELEAESAETEPTETEPAETEPTETEPADTAPAETEPTETEPVENTEKLTDENSENADEEIPTTGADEQKGCGGAISLTAVTLIFSLSICAIVTKRK